VSIAVGKPRPLLLLPWFESRSAKANIQDWCRDRHGGQRPIDEDTRLMQPHLFLRADANQDEACLPCTLSLKKIVPIIS
jgi:hypothetical protein